MFNFFKKKTKVSLFAVCSGTFKPISKVNDPVFANKIMGDGFAITPKEGKRQVYAPIKGKVLSIFPTKHAITFVTEDGIEGIVHMGIDTVTLNGEGFDIHITEDQIIDEKTLLATMDVNLIKSKNKNFDIVIIFTNLNTKNKIIFNIDKTVESKQNLGYLEL